MTARENYVVVCDGNGWRISFSGNLYGRYASEAEATEVALTTARAAAAAGHVAGVLVQTASGAFRTEAVFEAVVKKGAPER